jgi:hypothetical protein
VNQDLLQCIHRLASLYWSERGELRNARREHQLDRKQKRLRKRKIISPSVTSLPPEDLNDDDESQSSSGASEAQDQSNPQKDMYMALDGTALVAIGMAVNKSS